MSDDKSDLPANFMTTVGAVVFENQDGTELPCCVIRQCIANEPEEGEDVVIIPCKDIPGARVLSAAISAAISQATGKDPQFVSEPMVEQNAPTSNSLN